MTARAELSRLRRVLGDRIPAGERRLAGPIAADFAELEEILERGEAERALELYRGPLLEARRSRWWSRRASGSSSVFASCVAGSAGGALLERWLQNARGARRRRVRPRARPEAGPDDPALPAAASRLRRLSRDGG